MSTARAATARRRPVMAAALTAAGVLAASGCSFHAAATHGSSTASASASGGPASNGPASAPTTTPTSAPGTSTPAGPPAGTAAPAAPSTTRTTASPTAPAGAATAPPGSAPPPCRTADLRVSVPGGSGAAGSVHTAVELVNAGSAACVLSGHPGVSFVAGDDGHQVGAAAGREGRDLTPVTLAPGAVAHAALRVVGTGDFDPATCRPVPVTGLRVYPPDQRTSAFVARPGTACADGSNPQLTVGAVEPGPPSP